MAGNIDAAYFYQAVMLQELKKESEHYKKQQKKNMEEQYPGNITRQMKPSGMKTKRNGKILQHLEW